MRTFNDNIPCQGKITLENIEYKIKKLPAKDGNGFLFTVDPLNTESESIHFTTQALKALYLLITTNEEKK